jgi:hypothetical protein
MGASIRHGAPVTITPQPSSEKRSSMGTLPTPAKTWEIGDWLAESQLMEITRLPRMISAAKLLRLTHKSIVGGLSQTELTAEQVNPARPKGPSVATTVTAVEAFESAPLKAAASIASSAISCRTSSTAGIETS